MTLKALIKNYNSLDRDYINNPYPLINFSNLKDLGIDTNKLILGIDFKVRQVAFKTDTGFISYNKDPFYFTTKGLKKLYKNKDIRANLITTINKALEDKNELSNNSWYQAVAK